jgi:hypothetical protein
MSEAYCRHVWPVVRHAQSFQHPQVKIYAVLISTGVYALGNHLSVIHKLTTRHTTVNSVVGRFHTFYRPRRPLGRVEVWLYSVLDLGTRRRWGVSVTARPLSTPGKDHVPIVQEARFSALAQIGPGAHLASCTMGTGSFLGEESSRGVTLTPHPLLVPRSKNRVGLYLCSP